MNKLIYPLVVLVLILISCNTNKANSENAIVLGDTIQTNSGLQYYYIKEGNGRKVESGAKVSTYLSLMVKDSVIWTTNDEPDSLFTFIAGNSEVIKGFDEMTLLLSEGDEVVAIIPDSLAYGKEGSGDDVPPNSILIYDQFKVVKVEEPRMFLADTLITTILAEGTDKMIENYKMITTSSDSINYHKGIYQMYKIWETLSEKEMHQEAAEISTYFAKQTNHLWMRYSMVVSLDTLGHTQQAFDSLEVIIKDKPESKTLNKKMQELKEKLEILGK